MINKTEIEVQKLWKVSVCVGDSDSKLIQLVLIKICLFFNLLKIHRWFKACSKYILFEFHQKFKEVFFF